MKKFKPTYLLIFTLLIAWALFSNCSKDSDPVTSEDQLIGTWKLTEVTIVVSQDSTVTVDPSLLGVTTFTVTLNNDNSLVSTIVTADTTINQTDQWRASGNTFTIISEGEETQITYSLSGDTFILQGELEFFGFLVNRLKFIKQ